MTLEERARNALCLALDAPEPEPTQLARGLADVVGCVKVGLWLFTARGPGVVRDLRSSGFRVFLDLKLHDIPNTVESAAREAAALGVSLLTVHASGGAEMIRAAARGAAAGSKAGEATRVIAVTILTSLNGEALSSIGMSGSLEESVQRLCDLASSNGAQGVVCSPAEAAKVRGRWSKAFVVVPGIRPAGAAQDDQARVATPAAAVRAGGDLLVVGRPILQATDPRAAALAIRAEMQAAFE